MESLMFEAFFMESQAFLPFSSFHCSNGDGIFAIQF